jgi:hypothetical protein
MKILSAWVDDPTVYGTVEPPILVVEVDEYPDETLEALTWPDGWSMSKYGPFVMYDFSENHRDIDAGDYNVRFAGAYPPVVDIVLRVGSKTYSGMFSLPLTRARQLVRKHCKEWRLYISDADAQKGALLWVPQEINPTCHFWTRGHICGTPAGGGRITVVQYKGVQFPLCDRHLTDHNNKNAEARRANTSK